VMLVGPTGPSRLLSLESARNALESSCGMVSRPRRAAMQ
jgi:hypothetical protein